MTELNGFLRSAGGELRDATALIADLGSKSPGLELCRAVENLESRLLPLHREASTYRSTEVAASLKALLAALDAIRERDISGIAALRMP